MRSGAYTATLSFMQERLIGPSLGKENIRQGIRSMVVAMALVVFLWRFIIDYLVYLRI